MTEKQIQTPIKQTGSKRNKIQNKYQNGQLNQKIIFKPNGDLKYLQEYDGQGALIKSVYYTENIIRQIKYYQKEKLIKQTFHNCKGDIIDAYEFSTNGQKVKHLTYFPKSF